MPEATTFRADLADLAAVVGGEAAQRLIAAFGGRRLYVPANAGDSHVITATIGAEAARQLCEYWHGTEIYFPIAASRKQRILDLAASGMKSGAIVAELMVSRRHVQDVLAEARKTDQLKLF